MIQKLLKYIGIVLLVLLPIVGLFMMSPYSPALAGNELSEFIFVTLIYLVVSSVILLMVINRTLPRPLLVAGVSIFVIGSVVASVLALGAPDVTASLLQHPEREHYRYSMLFVAALLFASAFILIIRNTWGNLSSWNKWIVIPFILALGTMFWEFIYHYHYPEGLVDWIASGERAEDFKENYDNMTVIYFGATGRCCQYAVIAWLTFIVVKHHQVKKWVLVPISIFCIVGVSVAIAIMTIGFNFPPSLGILVLFFIPSGPMITLYWAGISLLSKSKNS